jgi:hypothetical protein
MRGMGLWGLGAGATTLILVCLLVPLLLASASLHAGLVTALPAGVAAALTLTRVRGVPLGHVAYRRARWAWGTLQGRRSLRAGAAVVLERAWSLPAPLATMELISAEDGRGGTFGLVHDRRTGTLTATLRCASSSTWLVDSRDADGWVSNWHSWLASLGYVQMVRWVTVTVDTAPEPGTTLQDTVLGRIDPSAPPDAQALVRQLVQRSPGASADVETRVSITFDPSASTERLPELHDRASEVSRLLAGFESQLGTCGVTVLGRASEQQLCGMLRVAYDPASRGDVERALARADAATLLHWGDSGPVAAEESWDRYRHDSGVSVSWGWHEAPRQHVTSDVLTRLLSPGRYPKRVTLLYRPLSAGDAARVLESQVNAAAFRDAYRRAQKRDETARDAADREQAKRAAREEALGAGVVLLSLYATVTVTDEAALPEAVADIEARADQCKVRIRRLFGGQATAFATTLPAGVCPPYINRSGIR